MSRKSLKTLSHIAAITAIMAGENQSNFTRINLTKSSLTEDEKNRKKGLKPFNINGEIIWAINEKNAIKKAKPFDLK